MKPMERPTNPRPVMNDAQRLHYYGRLRPMPEPTWWQRLLERIGL